MGPRSNDLAKAQAEVATLLRDRTVLAKGTMSYAGGYPGVDPPPGFMIEVGSVITADLLVFERLSPKRQGVGLLFKIPVSDLSDVVIDDWSAERSEFGWKLTTGFLHRADRFAATSGLILRLRDGQQVIFRMGGPAVQVRAQLAPLTNLVARPESPKASTPAVGSVADELKKLVELRDAGVLTDEEFAEQKARLLG